MKTAIIILAILWVIGFIYHKVLFKGMALWCDDAEERIESLKAKIEMLEMNVKQADKSLNELNQRLIEVEKPEYRFGNDMTVNKAILTLKAICTAQAENCDFCPFTECRKGQMKAPIMWEVRE